MNTNYNTDVGLWRNYRESIVKDGRQGPKLQVHDGHVSDGMQILARFNNSADAKKVLAEAGWQNVDRDYFLPR